MKAKSQKIGALEKVSFFLANVGNIPLMSLLSSFFTLFYTTIVGLDPAALGTLFLISKVADGISDPIMGYFLDKFPVTKMGKFRPMLILGTVICVINYIFLWFGAVWSPVGKYVIVYITYLLLGWTFDIMDISLNSLLPVMTAENKERNSLSLIKALGYGLGGAAISILAPIIVASGTLESYYILIFGSMAVTLVFSILGALGVKERVTPKGTDDERYPLVREAVSYAVNQQELETSVFDGLETAAETLFTNEKPNCGVEVKTYPTDMEKAKQLMKEAGYEDTNDDGILEKDGTSLAIHFNYSQSLASVDNAVLSIAASLKELGFDVTIDAVDMNTWYGALMAGEYDLTFYNTAGGSFDPATDMSNMAPGAMGDPILCQFSAFFENPEIFAELDSTSDSQRVQEIYGMILNGIADQNLLVPVTGTHDLALWNTDKITGYDFYTDASYVDIASVHVK